MHLNVGSWNEIIIEILIIVHVTEYNINIFWVNSFMFGKFSATERRHFSRLIKPPYVWKYVSSLLMAIWYIFWLVFVFLSFTFFVFYWYVLGFPFLYFQIGCKCFSPENEWFDVYIVLTLCDFMREKPFLNLELF